LTSPETESAETPISLLSRIRLSENGRMPFDGLRANGKKANRDETSTVRAEPVEAPVRRKSTVWDGRGLR
jgi:hypothetical protein